MSIDKYEDNNIFAKILKGEASADIVYENKYVLCIKDLYPKAPIHILIMPKAKFSNILDFSVNASIDEKAGIFESFEKIINTYDLKKKGCRIITNFGEHGRQEVPHLHFHLFGGEKIGKMVS